MSSAAQDGAGPIRVAIVNDYEIVVAGLAAVLAPYADRVRVVELSAGLPVVSDVDVVLFDTFARRSADSLLPPDLAQGAPRLVVFSWDAGAGAVEQALAAGAHGFVGKGTTALELVEALEHVHRGEPVVVETGPPDLADLADLTDLTDLTGRVAAVDAVLAQAGRWPGDELGLSQREAEVLALICRGLSNEEITAQAFIGINTVKTHIRTLYRKIGVTRRTQAVLWGHAHGFEADRSRDLDPT
ncbi:response regulator transcription factor [Nocardioides litoris]|uniref:response regulator transcription factor n=1 Tax=Nocardioides litoris TaxID=1926648 RepID=UPI001B8771CB|nr:response regulator transcription factor [Nocardioides litoris]